MGVGGRINLGVERGKLLEIDVDGEKIVAYEGETVAAALIASGKHVFRHTTRSGAPRGVFCGMGICFDCEMTVNGLPNVRTCVTPVQPGMTVQTQREPQRVGG